MTQKLIEAALAYGRAHDEFSKRWDAWRVAAPDEYRLLAEEEPTPAYDRDVVPAIHASNAARDRLAKIAEELYAGSAGLLALADEATAREPSDENLPDTARLV